MYSVRIVNLEYYMCAPILGLDTFYSDFRSSAVQQVPVIRIFGATPDGVKTCLHVHGAFPYIYTPCPDVSNSNGFVYQMATALDKALNVSLGEANSTVQHVYKITLVSGTPFYGYHRNKHQFLKIYFYNPMILRKACQLLQNGSILGKLYQPHEAHIQFTLQFMIDHNLHGMNFVNLSAVKYRSSIDEDTPPNLTLPLNVKRVSTSHTEIDALVENITNRTAVDSGQTMTNPGIAALWEDEQQRRRNQRLHSQFSNEQSQQREGVQPTRSHSMYSLLLKERIDLYPDSLNNSDKNDLNNSVYPVESPRDNDKSVDASQIDFCTFGSTSNDVDGSILDERAEKLLSVLKDLGEADAGVENDSILSQTVAADDISDDESDMTLALEDLVDLDPLVWDETFNIPQVDGQSDSLPAKRLLWSHSNRFVRNKSRNCFGIVYRGACEKTTKTFVRKRRKSKLARRLNPECDNSTRRIVRNRYGFMNRKSIRRKNARDCYKTLRHDVPLAINLFTFKHNIPQVDGQTDKIITCRKMNYYLMEPLTYPNDYAKVIFQTYTRRTPYSPRILINVKKKQLIPCKIPEDENKRITVYLNIALENSLKYDLTSLPRSNSVSSNGERNSDDECRLDGLCDINKCLEENGIESLQPYAYDGSSRENNNIPPESHYDKYLDSFQSDGQATLFSCLSSYDVAKEIAIEFDIYNEQNTCELDESYASIENDQYFSSSHINDSYDFDWIKNFKTIEPVNTDQRHWLSPTKETYALYDKLFQNKTQKQINAILLSRHNKIWNKHMLITRPYFNNGCYDSLKVMQSSKRHFHAMKTRCHTKYTNIKGILINKLFLTPSRKNKRVAFDNTVDTWMYCESNVSTSDQQKKILALDGEMGDSSDDGVEENEIVIKQRKFRPQRIKPAVILDDERIINRVKFPNRKQSDDGKGIVACRYKRERGRSKEVIAIVPTKVSKLTVAEEYDRARNIHPVAATSSYNLNSAEALQHSPNDATVSSVLSEFFTQTNVPSDLRIPMFNAPSYQDVINNLANYNIPEIRYQQPFYSNAKHATGRHEIGHNTLTIGTNTTTDHQEFVSSIHEVQSLQTWRNVNYKTIYPEQEAAERNLKSSVLCKQEEVVIEPCFAPPTYQGTYEWFLKQKQIALDVPPCKIETERVKLVIPLGPSAESEADSNDETLTLTPITPSDLSYDEAKRNDSGQITGATLNNTYGFKTSLENLQNARAVNEHQRLTVLLVEIHTATRSDYLPDPEHDAVRAIFYSVFNDVPEEKNRERKGVFVVDVTLYGEVECASAQTETEMLRMFCTFVRDIVDPDIVGGYEIETASWGYLIERGCVLGLNLLQDFSRVPTARKRFADDGDGHSQLKLEGRIVLDVWRILRHEIALQCYTFENVAYHILHARVAKYSYKQLSFWWERQMDRRITAEYYLSRVSVTLQLFHRLDLINRTSELARLFGIQFYEVLSRGSQFRVESMMLRLAKPQNYVAVSPSTQQRAKMRAPEYLPLILEPESKMYVDPVIVLDFQSLYPSMIIAYNYCFSTCLGRLDCFGRDGPFEFGATMLKTGKSTLTHLQDKLTFSPCGVAFVTPDVRKGILPKMLQEILDTRLMVKKSMKENKHDKLLQRVLHSRQLGLKLIANVTYGYTAANFSGRMPCVEIGDSVVSKGRETLERAIKLVNESAKWNARVVYGDTDSLFVLVPGRTKDAAFKVGDEICEAVNAENPQPVKLKLEKVYQPCVLQTKKRYVGYMYESPAQERPAFEAKGIETVRRDGCPVVSKMLEKCIRLLFDTRDVSLVRRYVTRQFDKVMAGRINIQDLIFAKEYRGASGYKPGACVPALELAKKWTQIDKRREPRRSERVPYVIINGPPGVPLIRLVRSPLELMADSGLNFNVQYYISKVIIPPINRCFLLIGADLHAWFNEMSRKVNKQHLVIAPALGVKKSTIAQYFATTYCLLCNQQTKEGLCIDCRQNRQSSAVSLLEKINKWERSNAELSQICETCVGQYRREIDCVSMDCPVFYKRKQSERDIIEVPHIRSIIDSI